MKVRFKTKDGLECVKEVKLKHPLNKVVRRCLDNTVRFYQYKGETLDPIPTLYEI